MRVSNGQILSLIDIRGGEHFIFPRLAELVNFINAIERGESTRLNSAINPLYSIVTSIHLVLCTTMIAASIDRRIRTASKTAILIAIGFE